MTYLNRRDKRKIDNLAKLVTLPDKGVSSTTGIGGVLSRLFRQMLYDFNVFGSLYGSLVTRFMNDPLNKIPDNRAYRASKIGNLNKELGKPSMSWKKLIEAIRFLQFHGEAELIFRGTSKITGKVSEHTVKFNLGEIDDLEDLDEEEADNKVNKE